MESLEALQGIHRDLIALSEARLPVIDRLLSELESRIDEFRSLLSKKPKSDASRKILETGILKFDGREFEVNDDFKQQAIQIADELDLDEIEASELFLQGQEHAQSLDRSPLVTAIIRFHQRRQLLLESLQTILSLLKDEDLDVKVAEPLRTFVDLVTESTGKQVSGSATYWRKCVGFMTDVERWLARLAERTQRVSVLGESFSLDASQVLELETSALTTQHETLSVISTCLVQSNLDGEDLRSLVSKVRRLDRHDIIMVHYLPVLLRLIHDLGPSGSRLSNEEASDFGKVFLSDGDQEHWLLRNLHAAMTVSWFAQVASRGIDLPPSSAHSTKPNGHEEQFKTFIKLLQDGAFHFLLTIANDVRRTEWNDPVKKATVDFLLEDAVRLPSVTAIPGEAFQVALMNQYQDVCDAVITNLPDILRHLRHTEDEERRMFRSRLHGSQAEVQSHLERFIVIIAYAYDRDPDHAVSFWDDHETNLYGFLQWAAKRQTTPRVAAFCEMIRSISQDTVCADAAHKFLLEEGTPQGGKLRRTGSLSWAQIFAELEYYATHLNVTATMEKSASQTGDPLTIVEQLIEPESALMLECYLRLVTHLCNRSETVRTWLLHNELHDFPTTLFTLASTNIDSRLRAASFASLSALLTQKSVELSSNMWNYLDHWLAGVVQQGPRSTNPAHSPDRAAQRVFDTIYSGFEETNAFIFLLNSLIAPTNSEADLNDALPFPENLGSAYRGPGLTLYVDFVIGRVFGQKVSLLSDKSDQHALGLSCLDFIAYCLLTFNEHLVILANRATQSVESAMHCSSLERYVQLHPFARAVDWLLSEKVMKAVFQAAHQDVDEVNMAPSTSPLVLLVVRAVEVMELLLKLQETYFEIVRPIAMKQQSTRSHPKPEGNLASFEDAVMGNLQLVVDLGLYSGTGHQDLIVASLTLLERLSSSRKLTYTPTPGYNRRSGGSKLLSILEKEDEVERIARSLSKSLELDEREIESGPLATGHIIKTHILNFLLRSLSAAENRPTIAHALLGFMCEDANKGVVPGELFEDGNAMFQVVARLSLEYPETDGSSFLAWLNNIKRACLQILQSLWRNPLTSPWVMADLRAADYVYALATKQVIIGPDVLFDDKTVLDDTFLLSDSAIALHNFLMQRSAFFDLYAREVRSASQEGMTGDLARLTATLLGSTTFPGGATFSNPTLFDLFDTQSLSIPSPPDLPTLDLLQNLDFSICKTESVSASSLFDLSRVQELILLRQSELQKLGQLQPGSPDVARFQEESDLAVLCLLGRNQHAKLVEAQLLALKAWTSLTNVVLTCCRFEPKARSEFVAQTLQTISTPLEEALSDESATAYQLVQLSRNILITGRSQSADSPTVPIEGYQDRLFVIFRACYNGITSKVSTTELRELCYQTCAHYLRTVCDPASQDGKSPARKRLILRTMKVTGNRPVQTMCDDAYSGPFSVRVSAVQVLDELVALANLEESKYLLGILIDQNLLGVLVESIQLMPQDLVTVAPSDVNALISSYTATLTLLLRIAQTRQGATEILNAGFFPSLRDSGLFSADPDLGFDIESPTSLQHFFNLLHLLIRIINAIVLSKGAANEQTLSATRDFLSSYRPIVVSIFKRNAAIGKGSQILGLGGGKSIDLNGLVDSLTLLISATDFLEYEEQATSQYRPRTAFS